tara:strand:+ start:1697 stop:1912 length:216 start_codon:yes stop_codon:yes gene_type:complete
MGKKSRKYFRSDGGGLRSYDRKAFLVYWSDEKKEQKLSTSAGPYTDYKDAEKIMIEHLINGVCSWIVSYNG